MSEFISKTLGGLSKEYYFRQLFFGSVFLGGLLYNIFISESPMKFAPGSMVPAIIIFFINTLLYPYARFVYESIIGFFIGDNAFFASGFLLYLAFCFKLMMMLTCWIFAIFIAPIGLVYLYFYHSKRKVSQIKAVNKSFK